MEAGNIIIEWDEDGCHIILGLLENRRHYVVNDPEQLYDRVKGAIGPWLRERDEARMEVKRGVPEIHTPSESANAFALFRSVFTCPDYHSVHADIWDAREGK